MLILYNPCDILSTTALPEPALAGVFGNPSFLKSGGRASFQKSNQCAQYCCACLGFGTGRPFFY